MIRCSILLVACACLGAAPPRRSPLAVCLLLESPKSKYEALAFSPDGKRFATSFLRYLANNRGIERELQIRETATGKLIAKSISQSSSSSDNSLVYSPDGKTLAAFTADGVPRLFAAETLEQRAQSLIAKGPRFSTLSFSTDGKSLGACDRNEACVWRLTPEIVLSAILKWKLSGWGSTFSPDCRIVAVPNQQDVDLWDLKKGKIVRSMLDHRGSASTLAFDSAGRILAVAAHRRLTDRSAYVGEIRLWDVASGKLLRTIELGDSFPRAVAFSFNGKRLVLADEREIGGRVRLRMFDPADGRETATVDLHRKELIRRLVVDATGERLGTIHESGTIRLWKVRP